MATLSLRWASFSTASVLLMVSQPLLVKCDFGAYKSVDLTHTQDENSIGWPGFKGKLFSRKEVIRGYSDDFGLPDQWIEAYQFTQQEHTGTHMDAPLHFVENGRPIDQIPMEQLAGNGVVFDLTAHEYENYRLNVNDVMRWEEKHGQIPDQAIVILHTGRSKYYHANRTRYMGFATQEDAINKNVNAVIWPGLDAEAAEWLIENRNVLGYAIDTISLDAGDSGWDQATHRVVLGADQWILENVGSNIKDLPPRGFFLMAMPYKLGGGSGAPTRLVALLDTSKDQLGGLVAKAPSTTEKAANLMLVMMQAMILTKIIH